MWHSIILQAVTAPSPFPNAPTTNPTPPSGVFNGNTLQSVGILTASSAALTTFFNAIGGLIKAHPRVHSRWLQVILPVIGMVLGLGMARAEYKYAGVRDPFQLFLIFALFVGGSALSMAVYEGAKKLDLLPSGGFEKISGTVPPSNVVPTQGVAPWQANQVPTSPAPSPTSPPNTPPSPVPMVQMVPESPLSPPTVAQPDSLPPTPAAPHPPQPYNPFSPHPPQ